MVISVSLKRVAYIVTLFLLTLCKSGAQNVSRDKRLGEEGKALFESKIGLYQDSAKTSDLARIGKKLTQQLDATPFDYHFFILDMSEPNAFALPGGYIFFTRGMLALANSEDELAGVMGHEIIHTHKRHAIRQQNKAVLPGLLQLPGALAGAIGAERVRKVFLPLSKGGEAIVAGHSRRDEFEADEGGARLASRSGYDPAALARMLTTLSETAVHFYGTEQKRSYSNGHPITTDRVKRIEKSSASLSVERPGPIFANRRDFLAFIDGVPVGPNPSHGVFNDQSFMHPGLNAKFTVPDSWIRQNEYGAVSCRDSTSSALLLMEAETKFSSSSEAANNFATNYRRSTNRVMPVETRKINGLTAHRCVLKHRAQNNDLTITVMWVESGGKVCRLIGASIDKFQQTVTSALESFAPLSKDDRASIVMRVINIVEAEEGETIELLNARTRNVISIKLTASINALEENHQFKKGDLVKIVSEVPY